VTKSFGDKVALKDGLFFGSCGPTLWFAWSKWRWENNSVSIADGYLKATEATLLIDSLDAFEDRVEVKRLGVLPDEPVFYSYLSGREILELSAAMHGLDVKATVDRIYPLID
jgi:ABC-2 type transport system ATP-binding protein